MKQKVPPRHVPNRHEKYIGLAWMYAGFSKDPSTQVGCVIIGRDNRLKGIGYNGPPPDIDDESFSWERPEKYRYIKHAEDNALRFSSGSLRGATLYVTAMPCEACMLDIVASPIKKVVYIAQKSDGGSMLRNQETIQNVMDLAVRSGIELIEFSGDLSWIEQRTEALKSMNLLP